MDLSSERIYEAGDVHEAAAIRFIYPRHTLKRVARRMRWPLGTAREYVYRNFNPAHRKELAKALLQEMDAQDVERAAWRRRLAEWASAD